MQALAGLSLTPSCLPLPSPPCSLGGMQKMDEYSVLKSPLTTESAMKKIEDNNTLVRRQQLQHCAAPKQCMQPVHSCLLSSAGLLHAAQASDTHTHTHARTR